ncbi:MAG: P4 alpha zinc-binding domain protein, partial [Gammaproteobacteria bacterium]|nr:P4 alpha zinc-binding domain protein [Gammaproteobacteria bacterium]
RVVGKNADCIVIPIRDLSTNKVVAIQCINPEGKKQTFGPLSGNGFVCGNTLNKSIRWFVVEGWADAISLVFHHYQGNAVAIASCGKGMMERVEQVIADVYKPDLIVIMEDAE